MHSSKQLSFLPWRKIIQFSRELAGSAQEEASTFGETKGFGERPSDGGESDVGDIER